MSIEQINSAYDRQRIDIDEPSILIRINQAFRYTMSEIELYDYTRGQWKLNPDRARKAKYAFAIYQGIIQEVYVILDWYPAGKTYSVRQGNENLKDSEMVGMEGRYEFVGNLAPEEIRGKYRYKSFGHYFRKGNSNPVYYVEV